MVGLFDLTKEMNGKVVHGGPALKVHDAAVGTANMCVVLEFPSKAKALEFYDSAAHKAWMQEASIGSTIKRDVRIIEAPPGMFSQGKSYWTALIINTGDMDKFTKYAQHSTASTKAGMDVTLSNGKKEKVYPVFKFMGPSDFREESLKIVPSGDKANPFVFPGTTCVMGFVVVVELGSHDVGAVYRESITYKNDILAAFDETYTTEDAYQTSLKKFQQTVFQRDLRILGV